MEQAAVAVFGAQLFHQVGAEQPLGRAHRLGVPFVAVAVVDRDEGRLAALREAHVVLAQVGIDLMAERFDRRPLRVAVRQRHARRFPDARHAHAVFELGLAFFECTGHRRGRRRLGRASERDVSFSGEQARGRVEADPSGTGQEHLAPRVQVGEVDLGAARPIERFHVALQLNQVARDESRGEAQMAQQLHQQPARVAARPARADECLFRRLHAGLEADQVGDVFLQSLVELDQEVAGLALLARDAVEVLLERRCRGRLDHVRCQLMRQRRFVLERKILRRRLEKEVERVEHRHLGHEVDLDAERRGLVGEHQPREVVRLRVLLPVDEMLFGLDPHRVAQDAGSRMRRRAQAHDLRAEGDRPVVAVVGHVVERDVDGHGDSPLQWVARIADAGLRPA